MEEFYSDVWRLSLFSGKLEGRPTSWLKLLQRHLNLCSQHLNTALTGVYHLNNTIHVMLFYTQKHMKILMYNRVVKCKRLGGTSCATPRQATLGEDTDSADLPNRPMLSRETTRTHDRGNSFVRVFGIKNKCRLDTTRFFEWIDRQLCEWEDIIGLVQDVLRLYWKCNSSDVYTFQNSLQSGGSIAVHCV